jgi:hypothetical protein
MSARRVRIMNHLAPIIPGGHRDFLDVNSIRRSEEALARVALKPWSKTGQRAGGASWEECVAALNRVIIRMAIGDDVSPTMRELLVMSLDEDDGVARLVAVRQPRRGRPTDWLRDTAIALALHEELKKQSRKRAYAAVMKRFGITSTRRLEQIRQKQAEKVSRLERSRQKHEEYEQSYRSEVKSMLDFAKLNRD